MGGPRPPKYHLTPDYIWDRCIPEPNSGCWLWVNGISSDGYGSMRLKGYPAMSAQRASFIAHRGYVPVGLEIDHLCRVRLCVNPDHLEAVTHEVNIARRISSTFCPHGHLKDGLMPWRNNRPYCKTCGRIGALKYLAKKRSKSAIIQTEGGQS